MITTGGRLKARFVIHAVGPRMGEGLEDEKLRQATLNSLKLADEKGLKSIAFPAKVFGPYILGVELSSMMLLAGLVGAHHLGRRAREPEPEFGEVPQLARPSGNGREREEQERERREERRGEPESARQRREQHERREADGDAERDPAGLLFGVGRLADAQEVHQADDHGRCVGRGRSGSAGIPVRALPRPR